jgi:diaminopimelate epimerase
MINFTKLQGTGNDFIFIDARKLEHDWPRLAREMCHRYFGVGADGLILVTNSNIASLRMRLFNSDGSMAEVSGNGLRCFAKYVIDRQIVIGPNVTVETMSGVRTIEATVSGGKVTHAKVNMGSPRFKAEEIPVLIGRSQTSRAGVDIIPIIDYPLTVGRKRLALSFVSIGNPHAVDFLAEPVADFPLSVIGPKIENHRIFPERVNFEIARVLSRNTIEARVWERGAGETLSCGSGACALAVIARTKGYTDDEVSIMLSGGDLIVYWNGVGEVYLSGPVEQVFNGEWPG